MFETNIPMANNSLSTFILEKLLVLQKKKDALMRQVEEIETQIAQTFSGSEPTTKGRRGRKPKSVDGAAVITRPRKKKRQRRGVTGEKIVAALETAGAEGASVSELSETTGLPKQNLHVWFNTTGKTRDNIKKIGRGRYRIV